MEFFKIKDDIPFMRHALVFNVISIITFLIAVGSLATKGLNFGVDFTGGTVMEVHYAQAPDVNKIRETVSKLGYTDAAVQNFGTSLDVLIRLPVKAGLTSATVSETVRDELRKEDSTAEVRRVEFVGPQVGKELVENGGLALLFVSIGIVAYLALRFEWKFGLAAILAILGYSVNESVVVFDRIRENFRKMRKASVTHVIDNAITRTISRTIITHGCTQLMVTSMLVFGGETLHYFALALTIGICFGIYSSVLVASPIVMWLGVSREDLVKPEKKTEVGAVI